MLRSLNSEKRSSAPTTDPLRAEPPELREATVAAVYYGQRQAGDFYDFLRVHPDRVLFGLFDAAGGLEDTRAILCAVQDTFRSLGTELFAKDGVNEAEAMIQLSLQINRKVLGAEQRVHSCPAFIGAYNESLGIVCYCNAGHTPGLVRDHNGVTELPATGLPFGLFSHATTDAPMVALEPGAALLLVSRGVVEGKNKDEEFGLARAKEALQNNPATSAKELCLSVLDRVRRFMATPPTHDDVTALALLRANAS